MKYYPVLKNEMPFAATRMQLEIITLNKVTQEEKDKYHICGFWNTKQMNLSME